MFDNTKKNGQVAGAVASQLLTKLSQFIIITCILNPVCHAGSFMAGFSEGFSKKKHIAGTN